MRVVAGFEDLGLLPELVRATQELGWLLPSDVQDEAIPLILGGGDVMAVRARCCFAKRYYVLKQRQRYEK